MNTDTPHRFSQTAVVLHWIVGLAVITMLAVGIYMAQTETRGLYPLHKSFGVLIFFIAAARVAWRSKHGWPVRVAQFKPSEQQLAKIGHYVLLIGTLLMPISGFLMSSFGGTGVAVSGFEIVARNPDPANPGKVRAHNTAVAAYAKGVHSWLGYLLVAVVALHGAGAYKRHRIYKKGVLWRMLGARI
jgi:cytochrome b561